VFLSTIFIFYMRLYGDSPALKIRIASASRDAPDRYGAPFVTRIHASAMFAAAAMRTLAAMAIAIAIKP
jgi:hypothetical protein